MSFKFEMPKLSPTMEKGNVVSWCKNEGDHISIGDVVLEIDTDKATMEVESTFEGVLEKILIQGGSHDVPVRTPIAIIGQTDGESVEERTLIQEGSHDVPVKTPVAIIGQTDGEFVEDLPPVRRISPLAKRIANDLGVDVSKLTGTGPNGRIVKADVTISKCKYVDEPVSQMRRIIAEKLTMSKQETPHFYMNSSADVTELLKFKCMLNKSRKIDTKITVNDLIVKAVALAIEDEPAVNVSWNSGQIRKFNQVDISVAVAVDGGLITPIVENANLKNIQEISKEIKFLVQQAKSGKLKPEQFIGGGITVSNLGMYKIDSFSSIINPPQASILSIGPAKKAPIYNEDNQLVPANILTIGYAIDHRVIDGATAAKFLETLVSNLENPMLLIV
ncbi:MAG: 2-oxo acid dehydrogenase subunit E2 [Holosporales bacterium]|jgi:pyruvate dehydrogenase E2 component (dihydrolipoamide acetyltransferase)|nr:2-oxo acid dehydrogenase subunit E2 [Holosporales bacterium]